MFKIILLTKIQQDTNEVVSRLLPDFLQGIVPIISLNIEWFDSFRVLMILSSLTTWSNFPRTTVIFKVSNLPTITNASIALDKVTQDLPLFSRKCIEELQIGHRIRQCGASILFLFRTVDKEINTKLISWDVIDCVDFDFPCNICFPQLL